jgi:elongation factor G
MTVDEFIEALTNGESFVGYDFSGSNLSGAPMEDIDLTGANLSNTNLTNTDLSNANLTKANLSNTNLTNAKLTGAVFILTNLEGTGFEHLRQQPQMQLDLKQEITHATYLETVVSSAQGHGNFRQHTEKSMQFAEIEIKIEPIASGATTGATQVIDAARNVVYVNNIAENIVKSSFMEGVSDGIKEAKGILLGAPLTNVQITAVSGRMHEVSSSKEAFKNATLLALNNAMAKATMKILEPVYNLTIVATSKNIGNIVTAISNNQGIIQDVDSEADEYQLLKATMPYRTFKSFEAEVKIATGEDARFSAKVSHYEEMPRPDRDALIKQHKK